jgi:hypothetical protein
MLWRTSNETLPAHTCVNDDVLAWLFYSIMSGGELTKETNMNRWFWNLRLAFWAMWFYRWHPKRATKFAFQDAWDEFFEEDFAPKDAMVEDMSYA